MESSGRGGGEKMTGRQHDWRWARRLCFNPVKSLYVWADAALQGLRQFAQETRAAAFGLIPALITRDVLCTFGDDTASTGSKRAVGCLVELLSMLVNPVENL